MARWTTRRVPATKWVTLFASRRAEPGASWLYAGLVYRRCLPLPGIRLGVLVMPAATDPTAFRGARLAAFQRSRHAEG